MKTFKAPEIQRDATTGRFKISSRIYNSLPELIAGVIEKQETTSNEKRDKWVDLEIKLG